MSEGPQGSLKRKGQSHDDISGDRGRGINCVLRAEKKRDPGKGRAMTIFVGNIAEVVTEDELRAEFRKFGEVAFVNIVKKPKSRVSAGFGLVSMQVQMEAEAAIAGLDGKEFRGKSLAVNVAEVRSR